MIFWCPTVLYSENYRQVTLQDIYQQRGKVTEEIKRSFIPNFRSTD